MSSASPPPNDTKPASPSPAAAEATNEVSTDNTSSSTPLSPVPAADQDESTSLESKVADISLDPNDHNSPSQATGKGTQTPRVVKSPADKKKGQGQKKDKQPASAHPSKDRNRRPAEKAEKQQQQPAQAQASEVEGEGDVADADSVGQGDTPSKKTPGKEATPYINPERYLTGAKTREKKLGAEELAEKMARIRENNEKIKQRRLEVQADEDAFKASQSAEVKRQAQIKKVQEGVNRTREQNAQRKMERINNREWDSQKKLPKDRPPHAFQQSPPKAQQQQQRKSEGDASTTKHKKDLDDTAGKSTAQNGERSNTEGAAESAIDWSKGAGDTPWDDQVTPVDTKGHDPWGL